MIVSSSRYWFNYRHTTNALSIYQLLKQNGIPDDNIVLMLADEYAINDRNVFKNKLLTKGRSGPSLYSHDTEIDYRGDDVTVENFVRVLLGQAHEPSLPVLKSDGNSHVLIYLTGHGGDQFFKFQDVEEITSQQLARAFGRMHELNKYQELLFIADTCQAFTLADHMQSVPNVTVVASSLKGESSYAHHSDADLGLSVTERYTAALVEHLTKPGRMEATLKQGLVDPYPYSVQRAHIGYTDATAIRKMDQVLVRDFFANAVVVNASVDNGEWEYLPTNAQLHRFQAPEFSESGARQRRIKRGGKGSSTSAKDDTESWAKVAFPGMEPTDPVFLTWVAVFVGTAAWARGRL